jgi:hypothetical protein
MTVTPTIEGEHGGSELHPPMADAELKSLLEQARKTGDELLRRLVTDYITLRRVTADVIVLIESREGGAAVAGTPLLRRARALTHARRR